MKIGTERNHTIKSIGDGELDRKIAGVVPLRTLTLSFGGFVPFRPILLRALSSQAYVWHYIHDDSGATAVPDWALVELTYKCNLSCIMCPQAIDLREENSRIRENYPASRVLGLSEWKIVIDRLDEAGVKTVLLSGGEIFLLPYILDLLEYINSRKLGIALMTNGTLITAEIADFLVERNVSAVAVSLDGPEKVHNRIRQKPNAFENAIRGLELLIAAKQAHQNENPHLGIIFVLSSLNYTSVGNMPAIAKKYGATLTVNMLQFFTEEPEDNGWTTKLGKGESRRLPSSLYSIDPEGLKTSLKRLRGTASELNYPFVTSPPGLSDLEIVSWYTDPDYRYGSRCLAPWKFLNIDPSGRLIMCMLGNCVGNVLESPIMDILNSEEYKAFRRSLRTRGVFSWCTRCCLFNERSWRYIPGSRA